MTDLSKKTREELETTVRLAISMNERHKAEIQKLLVKIYGDLKTAEACIETAKKHRREIAAIVNDLFPGEEATDGNND